MVRDLVWHVRFAYSCSKRVSQEIRPSCAASGSLINSRLVGQIIRNHEFDQKAEDQDEVGSNRAQNQRNVGEISMPSLRANDLGLICGSSRNFANTSSILSSVRTQFVLVFDFLVKAFDLKTAPIGAFGVNTTPIEQKLSHSYFNHISQKECNS